jgi:sortase (surface protein transpeptidase)
VRIKLPRNLVNLSWLHKQSRPAKVLYLLALFMFSMGLTICVEIMINQSQLKSQVETLTQSAASNNSGSSLTGNIPSETPPSDDISKYIVPPSSPRVLRISKLKVEARIKRLGVDINNVVEAPANIYDSGWYDQSAKPGETGTVLLDGHVNGPSKPGVFFDLKKLVPGDIIEVERGDGKTLKYSVVKVESYPVGEVDMKAALSSAIAGKNGLNMITCDGKLDRQKFEYDHRLIIFSVQID